MTKNEIIKDVVQHLLNQRAMLVESLDEINYNEPHYLDHRNTIELQINNIDIAIDRRIAEIEPTPLS